MELELAENPEKFIKFLLKLKNYNDIEKLYFEILSDYSTNIHFINILCSNYIHIINTDIYYFLLTIINIFIKYINIFSSHYIILKNALNISLTKEYNHYIKILLTSCKII